MRYEGHRCTTYRGKLNNPDKLLTSIHAPPLLCTHWRRYRTTPAHSIGVRSSQLLLSFQITENGERHSSSQTTEVDWGSFSHALPLPPLLRPHSQLWAIEAQLIPIIVVGRLTHSIALRVLFLYYSTLTLLLFSLMAPSWLEILTSLVQISLFVRALTI